MNLRQLLEERARAHAGDTAVIVCDRRLTWAEVDRLANRAAHAMRARGVRPGDKIAVMLPNCWEFLAVWAGVAKLGAVIVPVNVHLRGSGLRYVLEHSETMLAVVDGHRGAGRPRRAAASRSRSRAGRGVRHRIGHAAPR